MARCPLCESDVPDGRTDCDACGQPFAKPPTTRVAPDAVRKAIESARKDLAASPRDPVDVAFPRGLLERAEQTEAAGDLGRALDLARASRRALDIIRRESRVADALKYADAVLEDAKQAGIETLAFQRNIEQARALAARGDHPAAERLLRRVSVRTLDQRRERILAGSLDKAESRVRYALERGGNVGDASALLADARKALAVKEYNKVRTLSAKAIEKADSQRKYARAETILDRAAAEVDASRRDGVNIAEARKFLTQARDALRRGVYADIPLLAQKARNGLREARVFAVAEVALRESDREAAREKRKGADVGRADDILAQGATALEAKEYANVRGFAKDAHDAVREASLLKTVREAFASLRLDAEDIRTMGAEVTNFEGMLVELGKAIEGNDLPTARRLVSQARGRAESTRETHFRTIMERSLQIILANATRGLDPVVARQLLREVDDAMTLGKVVDMQALIDQRMEDQDAQTEGKLNERVLRARDDIVALHQAGQTDTVGLEGKLADAAIAMQEGRYLQSDGLLDSVEHDISATRESLRSTAAEILGQARGEVARAKADGIPVEAAERMLKDAETSYSEARYGDTIYAGKACISEVEELAQRSAEGKRKSDAEEMRLKLEKTEGIRQRIETARTEITELVAHNLDLAQAVSSLSAAERAIEEGSLEEATHLVASAEGIVHGVKVTLTGQAVKALNRARTSIQEASAE